MDIVFQSCAGLDVHKETVVVCVRRRDDKGKVRQETRTFSTMTNRLLEMGDWLAEQGVTHLAMESTGVYWKPIWNLLEDQFQILLVNAQHIKQVPGRKTDVKDAEWIAQLLQHGLLRGSFVPATPQRQLRELTRQRKQLIQAKSSVANRIQKVLEDANIKLGSVASDVLEFRAAACWRRSLPARTIRRCWRTWRGGNCGTRSRNCGWPCRGG
jgi:transposase